MKIVITTLQRVKYSPCQGQSNLTPWKTANNHGRLQMPAIGPSNRTLLLRRMHAMDSLF